MAVNLADRVRPGFFIGQSYTVVQELSSAIA